jgi:uncharacterized peroxidase-related enzyme
MTDHPPFVSHTVESAPAQVRPHLARARQQFGFVPDPLARMAASPALVEAFTATQPMFAEQTRLDPLEREVVVMTVSVHNGCHYCVAMHTGLLDRLEAPPALVAALREGGPLPDPHLQALQDFTRRVLATRGAVGESSLRAFFAAGFDQQQALDVVLAIGVFTLTTYANRLTGARLDPPFERHRWTPPGGSGGG